MKVTFATIKRETLALAEDTDTLRTWLMENVQGIGECWGLAPDEVYGAIASCPDEVLASHVRRENESRRKLATRAKADTREAKTQALIPACQARADGSIDVDALRALVRASDHELLGYTMGPTEFYVRRDLLRDILAERKDANVQLTLGRGNVPVLEVRWGAHGRMRLHTWRLSAKRRSRLTVGAA